MVAYLILALTGQPVPNRKRRASLLDPGPVAVAANDDARVALLVRPNERQERLLLRWGARVFGVQVLVNTAHIADANVAGVSTPHVSAFLVITESTNHITVKLNDPMVRRLAELRLIPLRDLRGADVPTLWGGRTMYGEKFDRT